MQGRLRLSTRALYGAITRMLDNGWIRRVDDPLPNRTKRKRKPYALTEQGRWAMNAEIERLPRAPTRVLPFDTELAIA